tara:strand:- start:91 stop:447 length:357 start_codon:yes stop_codon:yes gene_type:complete
MDIKMHKTIICVAILITQIYAPLLYSKENDIQFKWKLIEVIASDIDTIKIDDGNFFKIDNSGILQIMKKHGNRYYPYTREGKILHVTSGEVVRKWEVLHVDDHNLRLDSPLGIYVLKR